MVTYKFERDGETFEINSNGMKYYNTEGELQTPHMANHYMPDDVIASTVVELNLSGWTSITEYNG